MSFWIRKGRQESTEQVSPVAQPAVEEAAAPVVQLPQESELLQEEKMLAPFLPGTLIHGKLSFSGPVRIEGQLSGEVFSSSVLVVGESGVLDARSDVRALDIYGLVKGRVQARELIRVRASAQLAADIDTPLLIVEEGGQFNGACRMPLEREAEEEAEPLKLVG